jgi:hypothetical protein
MHSAAEYSTCGYGDAGTALVVATMLWRSTSDGGDASATLVVAKL